MTKNTINVNISFLDKPINLNVTTDTVVEDVIIEVCKVLKIKPVARPLFALKNLSLKAWLTSSQKILEEKMKRDFEFAIRYNVPDLNHLKITDLNTYNYYFRQVKESVLRNTVKDIDKPGYEDQILGLSVCDMVISVLEGRYEKRDVLTNYRSFLPARVRKKYPYFLKKKVTQSYETLARKKCDVWFLKKAYLETFKRMAPNYLVEEFKILVYGDEPESLHSAVIRVNPFDQDHPGVSIKEEGKEVQPVCAIDELCFISTSDNGAVDIARKNGISIYLKFHMIADMMSFVTLLDGYYRLIAKWTFNLCKTCPTPSLKKLLALKCHGPISGQFAYRKLAIKANNEPGYFILRESNLDYDSYYVDVCTKASSVPTTLKIEKTDVGSYRLGDEEKTYPSLLNLIRTHRSPEATFPLMHCLPPSEYDQSNLLLCQTVDSSSLRSQSTDEELPKASPLCIDARTMMVFKNNPILGRSSYTTVYPGVWNVSKANKRSVAIKILEKNEQKNLDEFLTAVSRWAFINTSSVVKLYGVTLSKPVSMVMEHLHLGQLDLYLADPENRKGIKEVHLVEAATYLANALYYLAEAQYVHGYIRCRKLLVATHADNSFVVKLSDPGLGNPYTDSDSHWIPPEHYNNPSMARETIKSDVWAFATTLWEIFSYGALPSEGDVNAAKNSRCLPRGYLPIPANCSSSVYNLMSECWNVDPQVRKTPQEIMRDTNQIFYQVYNRGLYPNYTAIKPSCNREPDNVSNNSKTSGGCSTSVLSQLTLHTLLDDALSVSTDLSLQSQPEPEPEPEPQTQPESQPQHTNQNEGDYQLSTLVGTPNPDLGPYRLLVDRVPPFARSDLQDYNGDPFNSITSMQSIFELDKEWNVVLKGLIGDGTYGQVFKAELHHHYDDESLMVVAVKRLKRECVPNMVNYNELDEEITTLLKLDHPNIVKIIGRLTEPELSLVLEFVENGSLKGYVSIHQEWLTPQTLLKYAYDIAKGMVYLNEMKYVHRDLAARNILVYDSSRVKITDFGLARWIGNNDYYYYKKPDRNLPIMWYAPESIEFGKFSFQSDVWSYGVTLYEMFSYGKDPHLKGLVYKDEQLTFLAQEMVRVLEAGQRLEMPPKCPQYVYSSIIFPCWEKLASDRPTFIELCRKIEDILQQS